MPLELAIVILVAGIVAAAVVSNRITQTTRSTGPAFTLSGSFPATIATGAWYTSSFVATDRNQTSTLGHLEMNWTSAGASCSPAWLQVNELEALNVTLTCQHIGWSSGGVSNDSLLFDFSPHTVAALTSFTWVAGFQSNVNAVWVEQAYVVSP